jgi:hypothetical protein
MQAAFKKTLAVVTFCKVFLLSELQRKISPDRYAFLCILCIHERLFYIGVAGKPLQRLAADAAAVSALYTLVQKARTGCAFCRGRHGAADYGCVAGDCS